jgi:ribosomal protein S18 acetylase RimI-like enzyme
METKIQFAQTDSEIQSCFHVMRELRTDLDQDIFVDRIRHLQQSNGYQLAYLSTRESNTVLAVAGFRAGENLAWGKHVYLEDLVTSATHRSQGHGKQLLDWVRDYGRNCKCVQLHLDSRLHRTEAHAFYEREQMDKAGYHFYMSLETE